MARRPRLADGKRSAAPMPRASRDFLLAGRLTP